MPNSEDRTTMPVRYGWRLRLGMIIPAVNTEAEPQIEAMLPEGVTLHTTRLRMIEDTPDQLLSLTERIEEGASLLKDAGVDRILFHCTAVTTYSPDMAQKIRERIVAATGLPVTVTGEAVAAALKHVGARNIVMVTPYVAAVNAREAAYLRANGITVLRDYAAELHLCQGFPRDRALRLVPPHDRMAQSRGGRLFPLLRADAHRRSDRASGARPRQALVTSNQAAAWHALRQSGINDPVPGFGTLFERS